jgi:purine-binding chemotaxis protein CheW
VAEARRFCSFYVDGHLFGAEVSCVQEILRHQELTRVPLAPPAVSGLINLRGQIVPAIDLRTCLGAPPRAADALPTNVVVRTAEGAVSLLVDAIGDVLDVEEEAFEPPPDHVRGASRKLISGVYKLGHGLLLVLSVATAVNVTGER